MFLALKMSRAVTLLLHLFPVCFRDAYLGTDSDDVWSLHHPGFHPDTAEWLLTNRKIK